MSYDWLYTQPLHFAEHPLEDLLGTEVASAQGQDYDYETRDVSTRVEVLEFRRRTRGAGVTIYPLGLRRGATLALRGSVEGLPTIRLAIDGPGALDNYQLTNARAYDAGIGVFVADRSAVWGLGSHAFVAAGLGRIRSDLGDGRRFFAEGGGGLNSGPFGLQLAVKFAHAIAGRSFMDAGYDRMDQAAHAPRHHPQPEARCGDGVLAIAFTDTARVV